jgi:thioesterase domain-containing protein
VGGSIALDVHELPQGVLDSTRDLASSITTSIGLYPAGSYPLAGWCLGGPLAYEIALQAQTDSDDGRIDDVILIDPPRA